MCYLKMIYQIFLMNRSDYMLKIGVIFGGETVEHEVSIISALQAISNIDKEKYEVVPLYISKERIWYTGEVLKDINFYKNFDRSQVKQVVLYKKNKEFRVKSVDGIFNRDITWIDIALPIVHGNNVEDGSLIGYLDTLGICYVGSRVLGSSIAQDKVVMKEVMAYNNIPVVDYTWFYDYEYIRNKKEVLKKIKEVGYPVVVKPATLGSSVGITYVKSDKEIESAIEEAINYDVKVVVEKAILNLVEVNASVIGNYETKKVSSLEEVMGSDEILSFKDKYLSSSKSKGMEATSRVIPARISEELTKEIKDTSLKVCDVLNLSGVVRIDFLIDGKTNKFYVNEPNTIPGSLAFYLWKYDGLEYRELLNEIIDLALKEYKQRVKKVNSFESNILENFNGSKGIKK